MSRIFEALERVRGRVHHRESSPADPAPVKDERSPEAVAPPAVQDRAAASEPPKAAPVLRSTSSLISIVRSEQVKLLEDAPLFPFDGSDPGAAEQYKIARTKILRHFIKPRSLVVSSAQVGDGKSISAINLAGCLALKANTTVLLVDADMRRSCLAGLLGVPSAPGLSDVLAGRCAPEEAIFRLAPLGGLYFLPCGDRPANPAELLDSPNWRDFAARLRREFAFVLFDAPPVGLVADYDLIQDVADGIILVARPDHTNRTLCLKTIESVPQEKLIGLLLNCVSDWFLTRPLARHYDYYYGGSEGGTKSE